MLLGGEEASEDQVARFVRETKAASRLRHPNIVSVHDVGQAEGYHYFTMDYVKGVPLGDLIRTTGPVESFRESSSIQEVVSQVSTSPSTDDEDQFTEQAEQPETVKEVDTEDIPDLSFNQRVRLAKQILEALQYAHSEGLIHRDVKPANIMVSEKGEPVLMDFGLAHARGDDYESLTQSGDLVGTLGYMPPEQAEGRRDDVDERTDVYAMGAVLYELLTGQKAFEPTGNRVEDLEKIVREDPPRPRDVNQNIPDELDVIVRKAMEKEKNRRYPSAQAFAQDLERYLNNEPISARPPSVFYALKKSFQRRPAIYSTVTAATVVLLVGAIWAFVRIRAEKNDALEALQTAQYQSHLLKGNNYKSDRRFQQAFEQFSTAYEKRPKPEVQAAMGEMSQERWPLIFSAKLDVTVNDAVAVPARGKSSPGAIVAGDNQLISLNKKGEVIDSRSFQQEVNFVTSHPRKKIVVVGLNNGTVHFVRAGDLHHFNETIRASGFLETARLYPKNQLAVVTTSNNEQQHVNIYRLQSREDGLSVTKRTNQPLKSEYIRQPFSLDFIRGTIYIPGSGQRWSPAKGKIKGHRPRVGAYNQASEMIHYGNQLLQFVWHTPQVGQKGSLTVQPISKTNPRKKLDSKKTFDLTLTRLRNVNEVQAKVTYNGSLLISLVGSEGLEYWDYNEGKLKYLTTMFYDSFQPHKDQSLTLSDQALNSDLLMLHDGNRVYMWGHGMEEPDYPGGRLSDKTSYGKLNTNRYAMTASDSSVYGIRSINRVTKYNFRTNRRTHYVLPRMKILRNKKRYDLINKGARDGGLDVTADGDHLARLNRDHVLFFDLRKNKEAVRRWPRSEPEPVREVSLKKEAIMDMESTVLKYTKIGDHSSRV
ncbi:MAG: serine/threonine protein kinase, partial [bacterium]